MTRSEDILKFILKNQPCSADAIFTKGKIPKSRLSFKELETLVSQKKIQSIRINRKKIRYFVAHSKMSRDQEYKIARFFALQAGFDLNQKRIPKDIAKKFTVLIKSRIRILEIESKIGRAHV